MPWVKLDDRFPSHRKVALLSDRAFRLHVSALCWASENLTEGRILDRELSLVARVRGAKTAAKELEEARLWDRVAGGWEIHDYLEYNPDRARVQADREANAARQQAWRDRKRAEREAKKAAEEAARNAQRNGVTGDSSGPENDATATRTRHDGDTNARETDLENHSSPQVSRIHNAVSNGAPSRPVPSTGTSFGSTGAASEPRAGGLPDPIAELKRAVANAGLTGVGWDLRDSGLEYTRQAMNRVGVAAMVAYAVNSARLKGMPAGASAWVQGWRSLEAPEQQDGVTYLPSAVGESGPVPRQQQQSNEQFDRQMARAQARRAAREAQEGDAQ